MTRMHVVSALLTLGMVGSAHAESRATYRWVDPALLGAQWQAPSPANVSHIIYMNNCQPSGCTLHPGNDNSTTDTSSVPNSTSLVSAYQGSASQWQQLVDCVRQTYAPFNVQIVTSRPASGTNYHMAIVAGHASDVGEGAGVLGVSPFSCGYIPNSISFTFANEEPTNILDLCWTVAQETAHSWGLDHKYDNRDPMTYLTSGPAMKTFQNQAGACGEYSARQCNCTYQSTGSSQENSYALIMATFGSNVPDTKAPTVTFQTPASNASVMPGFGITANVSDDVAVASAELKIDGQSIKTLTGAPWAWNAPQTLGQGSHHVEIDAKDLAGNVGTAAIDVTYGSACTKNSDCMDSKDVCSNGHCVPGPGEPGGLGSTCMGNGDCMSSQCADDGQGHKYCVEQCDPMADKCPGGFGCVATGMTGVCWPGADNGGGGGCNSSGDGGVIILGLMFGAALITRRRR